MSKQYAIEATLNKMTVGQTIQFPIGQGQEEIEVERIFSGTDSSWIVRMHEKREVLNTVQEVAQFVSKYWNPNLKKSLRKQYMELEEVEDLGEF